MEVALMILAVTLVVLAIAVMYIFQRLKPEKVNHTGDFNPELLLAPIREQINNISVAVNTSNVDAVRMIESLKGELLVVAKKNDDIFKQGTNLGETTLRISTALAGTGKSGSWGEMQLERTLELAGLSEKVTFLKQFDVIDPESGAKLTPDAIVHLPENRYIVIDSKSPLMNLDGVLDPKALVANLKKRIDELTGKNYIESVRSSLNGEVLDFIVCFVPAEGILASASTFDPGILDYAISKNIVIATPMTLVALLRAVANGWQQIHLNENSKEILEEAFILYDRFKIIIDKLNETGVNLKRASDSFDEATRSINTRLMPQLKRINKLAAKKSSDVIDVAELNTEIGFIKPE